MEELLVFAFLLQEELAAEEEYHNKLDELFLASPEDEDLLYLEWETDVKKAVIYIQTHVEGRWTMNGLAEFSSISYGCVMKNAVILSNLRIACIGCGKLCQERYRSKNRLLCYAMQMTLCRGEMKNKLESSMRICWIIISKD